MKHFLLITLATLASGAIFAQTTPAVYPGLAFNRLSADGKWAVSDPGNGDVTIINFETGDEYNYSETYSGGSGNYVSNTGVVVGYNIGNEKAVYWENGSWNVFSSVQNVQSSYANGITPDGSRIVGCVSPENYAGNNEGMMAVPVYWDLGADGTYGEINYLPHPTKDFTGRDPQYVTAVVISEDGKTIAGQLQDFSGFVCQPIIYRQDENGDWEYTLLLDELFTNSGVVIPEDPGEAPEPQQFMTPDEIASYEEALRDWEQSGGDYDTYPDIYDFMDPLEYMEFYDVATEWNEASFEYYAALNELYLAVPNFGYNNVFMTSDAHFYATTDAKSFYDEGTGYSYRENIPYLINLDTLEYNKYPSDDVQIYVSSIADNGTVLGQDRNTDYNIFNAYILPYGEESFISLYDYVKEENPELGEWMYENMYHQYEAINIDTWEYYYDYSMATGIPYCTPDMSLVGLAVYNFWDYDGEEFFGYLISLPAVAGVQTVSSSKDVELVSLPGCSLLLKGDVKSLEIYDLGGSKVYEINTPAGIVNTGLSRGIYVARVTDVAGNNMAKKLVLR